MSCKDGIPRVCISWAKNDDMNPLQLLDQVRGELPRNKAIQKCLKYVCNSGSETLKGILDSY